ncbi:MAG: hypothetical protein BGO69_17375 [Bacteroidetes bacterium 46-16]|nr:MAG: hypothetical protein BGO69_17375 [Bacteroidetes bacterium 46-16]
MKKGVLLFTAVIGIGYLTLSSYKSGPGLNGQNRTGAKNSTTNCGGGGCHGGNSANTVVTITVDSAGSIPVTSYVPGMSYTIVINGSNTSSLPNFGFQFAAVQGTGAGQSNAGTFGTPLPAGVRHTTQAQSGILDFIENKQSIISATAGTYSVSFPWTAPAPGTGNVTMYCTLNAVDGNGSENNADKSGNTSLVLTEQVPTAVTNAVKAIEVKAYPNPVVNELAVDVKNAEQGIYHLSVIDMNGRKMENMMVNVDNSNYHISLNTSAWARGTYFMHIANGKDMQVIPVVKR